LEAYLAGYDRGQHAPIVSPLRTAGCALAPTTAGDVIYLQHCEASNSAGGALGAERVQAQVS